MSRINMGLYSVDNVREFLITEGKGLGPKDMATLINGLAETIRGTREIVDDGAAVREMDESLSYLEKVRG